MDDEGNDLDADEDTAMPQSSAASGHIPISYQCLPVVVLLDLIEAYGGKHVIDLAPGPLGLAADCPKKMFVLLRVRRGRAKILP